MTIQQQVEAYQMFQASVETYRQRMKAEHFPSGPFPAWWPCELTQAINRFALLFGLPMPGSSEFQELQVLALRIELDSPAWLN